MADGHMTLFQHHPNTTKSTIRKWFDKITHMDNPVTALKTHAKASGMVLRQVSEGAAVGGIMGAIHAELKGGLDPHGMPIDLTTSAVAGVMALGLSGEEFSHDMANISAASMTVFTFRKADAFLSEKKAARIAGETSMAGESTDFGAEDPILRKARAL